MPVVISSVAPSSICHKKGVTKGNTLISINDNKIKDVFDYQYYMTQEKLKIVCKNDDGYFVFKITKDEYEDIGLEFSTYLMDEQQSCSNKCIFCFVDQMPQGMRETLYFKDDDARLSFLFGNYVTLTNLKQEDIDRIIKMKISPINISVHTTNKALRCEMMNNRFAGEKLKFMDQLADAGILMNVQLVLCRGINDGEELKKTLSDLSHLYPQVQSVACVPVGLTKFREGLFELTPYDDESAVKTIKIIEKFAENFFEENGTRFAFASDEFYIKANKDLKPCEYYEEYPQLDNGVGMISLFQDEFRQAMQNVKEDDGVRDISLITGVDAYKYIKELVCEAGEKWKNLKCRVYPITNYFFGENITVTGLITAEDIIKQLWTNQALGDTLLIPSVMLRHEQDKFLDDVTVDELEEKLKVTIKIVGTSGEDFLNALLGTDDTSL